jgi:hypothetical protein
VGDKAKAVLRKLREMEAEGRPPIRKSEQADRNHAMIKAFFGSPLRVITIMATLVATASWTIFEHSHRSSTRETCEIVIAIALFVQSFSLPLWVLNSDGADRNWARVFASGSLWAVAFHWIGLLEIPFNPAILSQQ